MPWNPTTKLVERITGPNPEYRGNVWDQDRAAGIKIIATRHDLHDQDLADSISKCLNIEGINSMQANLDMNGFEIINLPAGVQDTDIAVVGQLFDTLTFNNGSRTLSISAPLGPTLSVVIPDQTGGAGGTVTSIDIGEGLEGTNDPIVNTGDIKLAKIHSGLTGSNGIKSITIDAFGRVTQVAGGQAAGYVTDAPNDGKNYLRKFNQWIEYIPPTGGGTGTANLSITRSSSNNVISAGGVTNAEIRVVTSSSAGLMSPSQKSKLDSINVIPPAGTLYDTLYWNGSGWADTDVLQINAGANPGVVVNQPLYVDAPTATFAGRVGIDLDLFCHNSIEVIGDTATECSLQFRRLDAPSNEKIWHYFASDISGNGEFYFCGANDAGNVDLNGGLRLGRQGSRINYANFYTVDSDFELEVNGRRVLTEQDIEPGTAQGHSLFWDNTRKVWDNNGALIINGTNAVAVFGDFYIDQANGGAGSLTMDGPLALNTFAGGGTRNLTVDNNGHVSASTLLYDLMDLLVAEGTISQAQVDILTA